MSLKDSVKLAIDNAISSGNQPRAPRGGMGLVLSAGARYRTLLNAKGLTPAGSYYYQKKGIAPPTQFDYEQDAVRKGSSLFIKTLDNQQRRIGTWDPVKNEWKYTKLGVKFYAKSVDRFVVKWPVFIRCFHPCCGEEGQRRKER